MSSAFSKDGAECMVREFEDRSYTQTPMTCLCQVYQLDACVVWMTTNCFKRVALQFPDDCICDSIAIAKYLHENTDTHVFILGDTSFGSCCVDTVAAEHHEADSLIHFGHACHSPTQGIPVMYVYGQWTLDVLKCADSLRKLLCDITGTAILLCDIHYHYLTDKLADSITSFIQGNLVVAQPGGVHSKPTKETKTLLGWTFSLPRTTKFSDCTVIYIGQRGRTLTNWMMNLTKTIFYSYDPDTNIARKENGINRQVARRYYMIEKIKDAQVVGILMGTLGISGYMRELDQLKSLIKTAGKKSYTFVVGKLNVAKLANFIEIDVYVIISCPENTLVDSSEFYRPIVTPYEMEIACNEARPFTGDYVTDFTQLLPGGDVYVEAPSFMQPTLSVSLITGGTRVMGQDTTEEDTGDVQMVKTSSWTLDTIAGDRLAARSWQGLEQKLGQTPVTKAVEGRRGIAMGYKTEPKIQKD